MGTRGSSLKIRLAADEAENLKAYAKQCGLTVSALLRMIIQGYIPKPLPGEAFWSYMNCLYEIHSGLRKIAEGDGEDSDFARETQQELEAAILQLQAAVTLPGKAAIWCGGYEDMGG
jgi:predicted DNA-binding protein